MHLSITTSYLAIVGLILCTQLSLLFLHFPHQGKVFTVDQLTFFSSDSRTSKFTLIEKTPPSYENVGVGILKDSSLMGTFPIPPPDVPPPLVASINMISTSVGEIPESYDPWIVPRLEECPRYGDQMPLSPVELTYQAIQLTSPSSHSPFDTSPDPFHTIFQTDETIMEIMSMEDTPWDDGHHHSILFLKPKTIETYQWISNLPIVINFPSVFEPTHDV
jgi:hypothetical protein